MANINDLFESLPDYNVFDDSTTPKKSNKKSVKKVNNTSQKITTHRTTQQKKKLTDSPKNHRNTQRTKSNTHSADNPVMVSREDRKSREDYRDGFGIYEVQNEIKQNFSTILFFPLLLLTLEGALRFSCNESFLTINLLFVFLFSMPLSFLLTFICTFGNARLNRHFVRAFTLVITLWYCLQIIYHDMFNTFLVFSAESAKISSMESFINSLVNQRVALLIAIIPLAFFTLVGRFTFPFKKVKVPAKIVLILLAVVFQFSGLVAVNCSSYFTQDNSIHSSYYGYSTPDSVQEKFGLLTMEEIDISHLFAK